MADSTPGEQFKGYCKPIFDTITGKLEKIEGNTNKILVEQGKFEEWKKGHVERFEVSEKDIEKHDKRLGCLERFKWKSMGLIVAIPTFLFIVGLILRYTVWAKGS